MQHGWCLPTPDLIISVTGGGRQCHMSTHLRKIFQRGLVVAAATTSKTCLFSPIYKRKKNLIFLHRSLQMHG